MRFRKKFGALGLLYLAIACLILADAYYNPRHHHNGLGFAGAAFLIDPVLRLATWAWVYWDIEPSYLRAQRFWKSTEIPWTEITRVGPAFPNRRSSNVLAIYFGRSGPAAKPGKVVIDPEDESGFLAELQKYAPQAVFERPVRTLI